MNHLLLNNNIIISKNYTYKTNTIKTKLILKSIYAACYCSSLIFLVSKSRNTFMQIIK